MDTPDTLEIAFKLGNLTRDLMKDAKSAATISGLSLEQKLKFQQASKLLDEASRVLYAIVK